MVLRCRSCACELPRAAAVEIPGEQGSEHFCSLRCAEAAEEGRAAAPLPPLPPLPHRLLVAVDGSGPSLRAAELAAALAAAAGGRVLLLHAIDPRLLRLLPLESGAARFGMRTDALEEGLRRDAEAQLERCHRICKAAGVEVASRIEIEAPARAIARASRDFDLVVMGSRGLGALSGAALGSLSHRVIAETEKPVLVVH